MLKGKKMPKISQMLRRMAYLAASTLVSLGSIVALIPQSASANPVSSRSIQMSTSSNAGSSATTTYLLNFTIPTGSSMTTLRGIVIDFCSNSPIIGDTTCSGTVGTTVPTMSTTGMVSGGVLTASGWTAGTLNANRTYTLTNATGVAVTAGSSVVTLTMSTAIQNPTTLGTFYARIYTYSATAGATGYLVANPDTGAVHVDDGGIALSTANQITVTAKVQESLTFCVYTAGSDCAGGTVAGISLGTSGVLVVYNAAYVGATTAKIGLASNASGGVIVRAKNPATLTSGAFTITAQGNSCTADSTTTTVEQFGFRVSSVGANQSAATGIYGCSSGQHAFHTTNLNSTYGDEILRTTGAQDESQSAIEFAAKAATTTEPGIYTSTFTYIATGTY